MQQHGDPVDRINWLPGSVPGPLTLGPLGDVTLGLASIQASPNGVDFILVAVGDDAALAAFYEGLWDAVRQPGRLEASDVIVRLNRGSSLAQLNVDEGQGPALTLMGTQTVPGRFEARIHAEPARHAATWDVSVDWLGGQVVGAADTDAIAEAVARAVRLDPRDQL